MTFNSPEAWALKYFASTTLLSGLQPPLPSIETRPRTGSVSVGLELGWLPELSTEQRRVGFGGKALEDLNKAPLLIRPTVRVNLPWRFSAIAAAPPPFRVFGVTPRLIAFGLERPIVDRAGWRLGWRGYGQLGSVKGAFTCPHSVLAFAPGSADNPGRCIGESADVARLRYVGAEAQFAYRIHRMPKLVPHVASGINFIDGVFEVEAPLETKFDQRRLWTRGKTFSESAGASYLLTSRVALTVDAFYTPLWVQRSATAARTNDGLFNVRALLSYTFQ